MERVARVLIKLPDDHLEKWAREEELPVEEIVADLKDEFERFIKSNKTRKLDTDLEFIEWEDFCPNCESTFLEYLRSDKSYSRAYRCRDCEYEFTEKELER